VLVDLDFREASLMGNFGRLALTIGVGVLFAGCAGSQPPVSAPYARADVAQSTVGPARGVEFAYVANAHKASVSAYRITADGALTPVKGSPFAAGNGPDSLAIDPTGKFIYAVNQSGSYSTISGYTIDLTSGALTPIKGSPFPSGFNSLNIAIDPSGRFAYVTNYGNGTAGGYVSAYKINRANGALTQVKGSPFAAESNIKSIAVDPTGKFAYAGIQSGFSYSGVPTIFAYVIDRRSGALKPVQGSPFSAGASSTGLAVDSTGRYLYSVDGLAHTGYVFGFDINPNNGALTPIEGSPFSAGPTSIAIALEPSAKFAYVCDYDVGTGKIGYLSAYRIEQDGALKQLKGSPFKAGRNSHPLGVAVDPSGKFLDVTDSGRAHVAAYQIDRKGALTRVEGSPFRTGVDPFSVATCRVQSDQCVPPTL
jgi:6-phosphogluconolactonase